ncbi:Mss4-like protein [Halteromyces radiatus]|uniref:Mss4-like protein n=1 Tax=Halteromyces radiatus TaxID=101107 RepID=UPI00222109C5|nr:Mss4-like protein [Halteromyces radiatus]KAI8092545.1 Mss4-like protein [Halteromyces radiatus]
MELKGSCHCEKVRFTVKSHTPAPFMRCHCTICRKTNGGGGYCINIMGLYKTLKVQGEEYLRKYQAMRDKETKELCGNIRHFCGECGTHLYAYDRKYADYVYPVASCIDTPLPEVDPITNVYYILTKDKANWVVIPKGAKHTFDNYPDLSLEDWHIKNKKLVD